MKPYHFLFFGWALITALTGCKPEQAAITPDPISEQPTDSGLVTELGQPQGEAISKTIGPQGGTLNTPDGTVQLIIPGGAIAKATAITIQPITNKNPNGLAQAYRFLPAGLRFSKPATLTFTYDPEKISSQDGANFGVAYQRENHIWYDVAGISVNKGKHQINVPMQHFSDWTPYEIAQIEFAVIDQSGPGKYNAIVKTGESIDFYAGLLTYAKNYPKDSLEKPLGQAKNFGTNWKLIGAGKLDTKTSSQGVTYIAPSTIPTPNPVLITADLEFPGKSGKVILLQPVTIVGDTYYNVTIDGAPYITSHHVCVDLGNSLLISGNLPGDTDVVSLFININDIRTGSFNYHNDDGDKAGKAEVITGMVTGGTQGGDVYTSHYWNCHDNLASPGQARITEIEVKGGLTYVSGNYSATVFQTEGACPDQVVRKKQVNVDFRVLKP